MRDCAQQERASSRLGLSQSKQDARLVLEQRSAESLGGLMRKLKALRFVEEVDDQDSPVLAVLNHHGSPLNREEYLAVCYLGEVDPDEEIPDDVEETFPEQFRRVTLRDTSPASEKVQ
jgi:hypothetical protein